MGKVDCRPQQSNIAYWRNVANAGRGSQMTQCLHEACDYAARLESENAELRAALLRIARIDAGLDAWHEDAMPTAMTEARALLARLEG